MHKRIIAVECFTDRYFFAKLFANDTLIENQSNCNAVIASVLKGDNFKIGIVDEDKKDQVITNPKLKDFEVIFDSQFHTVLKCKVKNRFLFILKPRQLEHWLGKFLDSCNKPIQDFAYTTFNEFLQESKGRNPKEYPRLMEVLKFVLQNYEASENHILKIRNQINYLLNNSINFDLTEFNNV